MEVNLVYLNERPVAHSYTFTVHIELDVQYSALLTIHTGLNGTKYDVDDITWVEEPEEKIDSNMRYLISETLKRWAERYRLPEKLNINEKYEI